MSAAGRRRSRAAAARSGDRVEVDHGDGAVAVGRVRGEAGGAEPPKAPPSVETKTSVCGRTRLRAVGAAAARVRACQLDQRGGARGVVVRAGPVPLSSRCAMTTIAWASRPARRAMRFVELHTCRGPGCLRGSGPCAAEPVGPNWSRTHSAAPRPPAVPGRDRVVASRDPVQVARRRASNAGGRVGRESGAGRPTVNAASRSGSATRSHVPRTAGR